MPAACGCKATVLIADDNPFNLMALEAILSEFKVNCDSADDGVKEVDMFRSNMEKTCCNVKYKAVLTDLNMPNMDGFDAGDKILAMCKEWGVEVVPVLAVTAYENDSVRARCINLGFMKCLNKPVNPVDLSEIIEIIKK